MARTIACESGTSSETQGQRTSGPTWAGPRHRLDVTTCLFPAGPLRATILSSKPCVCASASLSRGIDSDDTGVPARTQKSRPENDRLPVAGCLGANVTWARYDQRRHAIWRLWWNWWADCRQAAGDPTVGGRVCPLSFRLVDSVDADGDADPTPRCLRVTKAPLLIVWVNRESFRDFYPIEYFINKIGPWDWGSQGEASRGWRRCVRRSQGGEHSAGATDARRCAPSARQ